MNLVLSKTCQIPPLADIYSLYFQDKIGSFVEVGAFDGESFSNTSCLADSGWKGLYIEPVFKFYEKCVERHKSNNIRVLNCAIGLESKEIDIYVGEALSTVDKNQVGLYSQIPWSKGVGFKTEKCLQKRLDEVFLEVSHPKAFDLLVVDVEGKEKDVFDSFSLEDWRPKMIICELEDYHKSFSMFSEVVKRCKDVRVKIGSFGYIEIYRDEINTIFVK